MTEMGRDKALHLGLHGDLAEIGRAGVGPGADVRLGTEIDRRLREGSFVNEKVGALGQLDQTVARRGVAGKHHRLSIHAVEAQSEAG